MRREQWALRIRSVVVCIPDNRSGVCVTDIAGKGVSGTVRAARCNNIDSAWCNFDRGEVPAHCDIVADFIIGG